MKDVARALASAYHAQDLQPEHPVRRAIDAMNEADRRISKLEDEAARHLALARENGQLRDVARRERDEARQLLQEARAAIFPDADVHGVRDRIDALAPAASDEIGRLRADSAELAEVRMALGGDAYWMDPPDGGYVTLAEMVARANKAGREADALWALLADVREAVHGADQLARAAMRAMPWRTPEEGSVGHAVAVALQRIDAALAGRTK